MGDNDDRSLIGEGNNKNSRQQPLPRCYCNWKMCRTYQRAFREYDHPIFHGVVRVKFSEYDETQRSIKDQWDRILGVDADQMEAWKDGTNKYYVARHHFTETMITEYLKDKKSWNWMEPLSKDDALHMLYKLKGEGDDAKSSYFKVPDVPRKVVKEIVSNVKANGVPRQDSISDLSVRSNLSTMSAKSTYSYKNTAGSSKGGGVSKKDQLEDLLASLPSNSNHEGGGKQKGSKSKKGGSSKSSSSQRKLEDALNKSEPNLSSDGKKIKSKTKDNLSGAGSNHSSTSNKSDSKGNSSRSLSNKSKKSPKKQKSKTSTSGKKPEDFEGELLELVGNGAESLLQEKISKLQAELFEQKSIAESAQEDLEESKRENFKLREDIRNMEIKVGRVSTVFDDDNVEEMEKLQLSLTTSEELHSVERESLQTKNENQETKIQRLEEELRQEKGKVRKLEMNQMKISAEKSKCDGLSSRRLMFLEEMENKLQKQEVKQQEMDRRIRYLEAENEKLKDKNRKLAVAAAGVPGSSKAFIGSGGDVQVTIETLEKEKQKLEEKNENQRKAIQALEGSAQKDSTDEAKEQAQKEDDLERGTALLANLYFTQKHGELLEQTAQNIALPIEPEEAKDFAAERGHSVPDQTDLLLAHMEKKQARWWKKRKLGVVHSRFRVSILVLTEESLYLLSISVDGIMGNTGYVKQAQFNRSDTLA